MKQAIIYTRFSPRPDADNCRSIEFQEDACRSYCTQRGLDVLATYRDRAISGKNMDRPNLTKALAQVKKIRGVLVSYSLARLSRGTVDAIHICEYLNKHNCDLVSVTEQIDTQTPMGRAIYKIMAVFAELERETTAERTRNILLAMQAKGQRISRHAPFGYKFKINDAGRGILVAEPKEKEAIGWIVRLRKSGLTLNQIGDRLLAKGYKPRGKKWYAMSIRNIIKDAEKKTGIKPA
jgi:site-specific DNA recombinase